MLSIQKIGPGDIDQLLSIAKKTFHDAFFHLCKPADFEAYTSVAFTAENFLSQINNPDSLFYFAIMDDEPAGYLKLNFNDAQSELKEESGMEIERIYILDKHQRKQIGRKLLTFAIDKAIEKQMEYIWLGVWEKNPNAIRFYENNGFKIMGKHTFPFGDELDEDWLMKKELV